MVSEKDNDSTTTLVGPSELKAELGDLGAAPPPAPEPEVISDEHLRDPIARFTSRGFTLAEIDHARARYPHWWRYYTMAHPDLTAWQAFRSIPCGARAPGDFALHWEDGCTFLEPSGLCRVPMCGSVQGAAGEAAQEAEAAAAVEGFEREGPSRLAMRLSLVAVRVSELVEKVLGRAY